MLFCLALHRRCRRVLELEPILRPAGTVTRAAPLRDYALAAERASALEDDIARLLDAIVNLQPYPRLGEQSHQQHLAPLDGSRRKSCRSRSTAHRTTRRVVFDPSTSTATPRR